MILGHPIFRGLWLGLSGLLSIFLAGEPARAWPVFAHRYAVSCQACHTIVPELNAFGSAFLQAGYRWPAPVPAHGTLPVALKTNLAYTSAPDPAGLPKAIVDEVELLSFGPVGRSFSYRLEEYWLEGGRLGKARDAYVAYQNGTFRVQAGQFTLPLPNDPETMRPTENHYAVFDQTVGENPFDLFNDGLGLNVGYGNRSASI